MSLSLANLENVGIVAFRYLTEDGYYATSFLMLQLIEQDVRDTWKQFGF
jgi:hypothetical protein